MCRGGRRKWGIYGIGVCDCGWEEDGCEDGVVGEVYADELGAAGRGGDHRAIGG